MTNIPTDLLRTLVTVVDLGSFTKAAVSLGLTQPAVSAQIKRLQLLLGGEMFYRSMQGMSLTPQGKMVVSYARRLLSINDQIVRLSTMAPRAELLIRIGVSSDYIASMLSGVLGQFRMRWPDIRFVVRTDYFDSLIRELRYGNLDLLVGLFPTPEPDARHSWAEEVVWVHGGTTRLDRDRPIPLVTYGEPCAYHRLAVAALKGAGLSWEDVFIGPSTASLCGAVRAGLGVMAIMRRVATDCGMAVCEDSALPSLPDLYCGIFVREGGVRSAYDQLAGDIAVAIYGSGHGARKFVAAGAAHKTSPAA